MQVENNAAPLTRSFQRIKKRLARWKIIIVLNTWQAVYGNNTNAILVNPYIIADILNGE